MKHNMTLTGISTRVQTAIEFAEDFPLSGDMDDPTTLTTDEFDRWGIANGYYDVKTCHQSKANMEVERNSLRQSISAGAIHDDFTITGEAYKLEVHRRAHKDDVTGEWLPTVLRVVPAVQAFATDSVALTKKVNMVVNNRREMLRKLLVHADFGEMPAALQAQAHQQLRSINNWAARARLETQLLENDFAAFWGDLQKANENITQNRLGYYDHEDDYDEDA